MDRSWGLWLELPNSNSDSDPLDHQQYRLLHTNQPSTTAPLAASTCKRQCFDFVSQCSTTLQQFGIPAPDCATAINQAGLEAYPYVQSEFQLSPTFQVRLISLCLSLSLCWLFVSARLWRDWRHWNDRESSSSDSQYQLAVPCTYTQANGASLQQVPRASCQAVDASSFPLSQCQAVVNYPVYVPDGSSISSLDASGCSSSLCLSLSLSHSLSETVD